MTKEFLTLGHGAGGLLTQKLVTEVFLRRFDNPALRPLDDAAAVAVGDAALAFTTDGYVVKPLFFPGGDIGKLAVCGTVNDLAVMGARPRFISAAMIIEEGTALEVVDRIALSMAAAAADAGVHIVCGDTKVVARGEADGVFIATAGLGDFPRGGPARSRPQPGDRIIINGTLGDHGVAILLARGGYDFDAAVNSDCASLAGLISSMLAAAPAIRFMRDPTRGGLAAALNDLARSYGVGVRLEEAALPVDAAVEVVCEALGLDALHLANEGKVIAVCPAPQTADLLAAMRRHPLGTKAAVIGEVRGSSGQVTLATRVGGERIVDVPLADPLPRIC